MSVSFFQGARVGVGCGCVSSMPRLCVTQRESMSKPIVKRMYSYEYSVKAMTVKVYEKSITDVAVNGIITPTTTDLSHSGGVSQIICTAAGQSVVAECKDFLKLHKKLDVTKNCVTGSGNLKCSHIIHAVGPNWLLYPDKENGARDLYITIFNILETAEKKRLSTIAMPPIGSGNYCIPKEVCAEVYVKAICEFAEKWSEGALKEVHIVDVKTDVLQEIERIHKTSPVANLQYFTKPFFQKWVSAEPGAGIWKNYYTSPFRDALKDQLDKQEANPNKESLLRNITQKFPSVSQTSHLSPRPTTTTSTGLKEHSDCGGQEEPTLHAYGSGYTPRRALTGAPTTHLRQEDTTSCLYEPSRSLDLLPGHKMPTRQSIVSTTSGPRQPASDEYRKEDKKSIHDFEHTAPSSEKRLSSQRNWKTEPSGQQLPEKQVKDRYQQQENPEKEISAISCTRQRWLAELEELHKQGTNQRNPEHKTPSKVQQSFQQHWNAEPRGQQMLEEKETETYRQQEKPETYGPRPTSVDRQSQVSYRYEKASKTTEPSTEKPLEDVRSFKFGNLTVKAYQKSLIEVKGVDAIVCSVSDSPLGGKLAEKIAVAACSSYRKEKENMLRDHKRPGSVFVLVPGGNLDASVLHVVRDNCHTMGSVQGVKSWIKTSVTNIIHLANTACMRAMALPLIGTGQFESEADIASCSETLIEALLSACTDSSIHDVHLVTVTGEHTKILCHLFEEQKGRYQVVVEQKDTRQIKPEDSRQPQPRNQLSYSKNAAQGENDQRRDSASKSEDKTQLRQMSSRQDSNYDEEEIASSSDITVAEKELLNHDVQTLSFIYRGNDSKFEEGTTKLDTTSPFHQEVDSALTPPVKSANNEQQDVISKRRGNLVIFSDDPSVFT